MEQLEGGDIFFDDFIEEERADNGNEKESEIQNFFNESTIFITGATGLLGQTIMEKLLRAQTGILNVRGIEICKELHLVGVIFRSTKIKRIYALVRPKGRQEATERVQEILSSVLFRKVAEKRDILTTVVAICGNSERPDLGLSAQDREMLIREVDVVIHGATTSAHDLRSSLLVNVRATKDLLLLARAMRRVKSIIHISSVFSSGSWQNNEIIATPPITYEKLQTLVEILDDNSLQQIQANLIRGWPDTRTYTQHVAEYLIREYESGLPVGILRPSIVISTAFEPLVGWINNKTGPQNVAYESLSGVMRVFYATPHFNADFVPADLTANAVLALACDIGNSRGDGPNIEDLSMIESPTRPDIAVPVVNFTSGRSNPISWARFVHLCFFHGVAIPKLSDLFLPYLNIEPNKFVVLFLQLFYHHIPALLMDSYLYLTGQQPRWIFKYQGLHKETERFSPYTNKRWKFPNGNIKDLWSKMSIRDRIIFNFNIESVDWNEYMKLYVRGIRLYIGKEDMNTLPMARKRMARIKIFYETGKSLIMAGFLLASSWFYLRTILNDQILQVK